MSDSASLHVHAIHPRVKLLPPGQHYAGERLVDLHRVDVFDPQRRLRQDFPRRRDRTGQHQHGVGPDHYLRHNARPLAEIELIGFLEVLQVWEGAGSALRVVQSAFPQLPSSENPFNPGLRIHVALSRTATITVHFHILGHPRQFKTHSLR